MAQHGVTHLVVVDPAGHPVGMLATLDLAGVIARGPQLSSHRYKWVVCRHR